MRYRDPSKCELRHERARDGLPCYGSVRKAYGATLCLKHRRLISAIRKAALENGTYARQNSHPVHRLRAMA